MFANLIMKCHLSEVLSKVSTSRDKKETGRDWGGCGNKNERRILRVEAAALCWATLSPGIFFPDRMRLICSSRMLTMTVENSTRTATVTAAYGVRQYSWFADGGQESVVDDVFVKAERLPAVASVIVSKSKQKSWRRGWMRWKRAAAALPAATAPLLYQTNKPEWWRRWFTKALCNRFCANLRSALHPIHC